MLRVAQKPYVFPSKSLKWVASGGSWTSQAANSSQVRSGKSDWHSQSSTRMSHDDWQGKLQDSVLADIRKQFVVRQSAVVLSELRRGARDKRAQQLVNELQDLTTIAWEPTAADWWLAGDLLRTIGDARRWETSKRREFQNDALIALTARHYGATVVTTNAKDFLLLAKRIKLQVLDVRS